MTRMYEPIWKQIKEQRSCTIQVPRHAQARVVKGVIKEKDRDQAFKDAAPFARLQIERNPLSGKVHFELDGWPIVDALTTDSTAQEKQE